MAPLTAQLLRPGPRSSRLGQVGDDVKVVEPAEPLLKVPQGPVQLRGAGGFDGGGEVGDMTPGADPKAKLVEPPGGRAPPSLPMRILDRLPATLPHFGQVALEVPEPSPGWGGPEPRANSLEQSGVPLRGEEDPKHLAARSGVVGQLAPQTMQANALDRVRGPLESTEGGERHVAVANVADEAGQTLQATVVRPQIVADAARGDAPPDVHADSQSPQVTMEPMQGRGRGSRPTHHPLELDERVVQPAFDLQEEVRRLAPV
jgi:hypothetical protein